VTLRNELEATRNRIEHWRERINWILVACDLDRDARNELAELGLANAVEKINAALVEPSAEKE
jgi:hypothetical protein